LYIVQNRYFRNIVFADNNNEKYDTFKKLPVAAAKQSE